MARFLSRSTANLALALRLLRGLSVGLSMALLIGCSDNSGHSKLAEAAIAQQNAGKLTAAGAINAYTDALKHNDIAHLFELSVATTDYEQLKKSFENMRKSPIGEQERKQFNESFGKLTADDAVDKIMQELEPKLAEYKTMLPGYLSLGAGALQVRIANSDLSADEKASATKAVSAIQNWASKTDFADPVRARKAVTALVNTARSLGLTKPEDVTALSFEQVLEKMGLCLGGFKKALLAYDFDLDAMLASVKATDLEKKGKVQIAMTLFGSEIASTATLQQRNGRWSN
jgi:hypothetical protein